MPTHTQTIVEANSTTKAMGTASTETIVATFPASPIYTEELTDDERKAQFQELVLDGVVNDGGHTFGEFSRDYSDAPNMADVETGGGGLPASPYVPNPVSPGPGSMNPTDQADPPSGFGESPNEQWGEGVGSQLSPNDSSAAQSAGTLGDYVFGAAWGSGT